MAYVCCTSGSPNGGDARAQLRHEGMGQFGGDALTLNIEDLSLGEGASWPAQDEALQQQQGVADAELQAKDAQINRLAGTLAHWRAWAAEVAARYAAYNPDVARPARRIYIGGLPQTTSDVRPPDSSCSLMLPSGVGVGPPRAAQLCSLIGSSH